MNNPSLGARQWQEGYSTLFTSDPPPVYKHASATLFIYLRRPAASDPADTYSGANPFGNAAANLGLSFVDTHARNCRHGTVTEFGA